MSNAGRSPVWLVMGAAFLALALVAAIALREVVVRASVADAESGAR